LSAALDVLICEVECIPAELVVRRRLPMGGATRPDPAWAPRFEQSAKRVPRPAAQQGVTTRLDQLPASLTSGRPFSGELLVSAQRPGIPLTGEGDFFVPERIEGVEQLQLVPMVDRAGVFRLEGMVAPDVPAASPRVKGALRLGPEGASAVYVDLDLPLPAVVAGPTGVTPSAPKTVAVPSAAPPQPPVSLLWMCVLAFAGGLLLNLMPCVFPVLALKAYAFARLADGPRRHAVEHALAYVVGVVGTLLLLAGAVIALRQFGRGVGWGFQFQEPLYVAVVSAVLVAFALNLFGVFDVGTAGGGLVGRVEATHGFSRSVAEGALAVALATPCSAPLLGTAMGFALSAPPVVTVLLFTMLGLGLALPFCVLVLFPPLRQRLPKPGAWMERAKQLLAFALIGTAVWLAWVLGKLAGVDGMARLLAFLTTVSLASWLYGLAQHGPARRKPLLVSMALASLVVGGALTLRFSDAPASAGPVELGSAKPWDEASVAKALSEGRPVFVDFTADWCLTCKFNEQTVLSTDAVRAAFEKHKVALFVADWTRQDARIRATLQKHGRAGVPMYLVYAPGRPEAPELLPEVITQQRVIDAVAQAAASTSAPGEGAHPR
jgi:thiol:disulfide interchange protein DsbD